MKQTAVEWLVEQLPIRIINSYQSEIAKANKMFEEQIMDAFCVGVDDGFDGYGEENKEKYYNDTFKK